MKKDTKSIPALAKRLGLTTKTTTFVVSNAITLAGVIVIVALSLPLYYLSQTLRVMVADAEEGVKEPQRVLQPVWDFLLTNTWGLIHSPMLPGLVSIIYYFVGCVPPMICDGIIALSQRPGARGGVQAAGKFLAGYKIQDPRTAVPTVADFLKALSYNTVVQFSLYGPLVAFQYILKGPWLFRLYLDTNSSAVKGPFPTFTDFCLWGCSRSGNGTDSLLPAEAPTVWEFGLHLLLTIVLFDAAYYAWHKIHHMYLQLYGHVHSFHHQYASPFAFTTQYIHPCELLATGAFTILLPICLGLHPLTELAWLVVSVQMSIDAHTGYEWPFGLENFIPFYGGTRAHDTHHLVPHTNFQPFFKYLDMLGGTMHTEPKRKQLVD